MRILAGVVLAIMALPACVRAEPWSFALEPVHWSLEWLDATYTSNAGLRSRASARVAFGAALARRPFEIGLQLGRGAERSDFGLLEGPGARMRRADATLELRWRAPLVLRGWRLQTGIGAGRLALRYDPEVMTFAAAGETFRIELEPVHAWTRQLAAELLHGLPGKGQLVVRSSWRFYSLDVATPNGRERRTMRDLQAGMAIRVAPW